jgi:hypothetical protein
MAENVHCADCQLFKPDEIGDGQGIGECSPYEAYKATNPGDHHLVVAYKKLGNQVFWGGRNGVTRNCVKFKEK